MKLVCRAQEYFIGLIFEIIEIMYSVMLRQIGTILYFLLLKYLVLRDSRIVFAVHAEKV